MCQFLIGNVYLEIINQVANEISCQFLISNVYLGNI